MAQFLTPNTEEVASKIVDGEAILINLMNGMYYSTDQVGGFVWSLIEDRQSQETIVAAVAQHYVVEEGAVSADIAAFTKNLLDEGLVVRCDAPAGSEPPTARLAPQGETYAAPQLNKFDDMAELFALDPPLPQLSTPIDPVTKGD
jgi:hypothetical protein